MATKSPPAPPIAPKQQTNQQSNQPPTGQPEEQAEQDLLSQLHQKLAEIHQSASEAAVLIGHLQQQGGQ